jgi:hypothetical protein
MIRNAQHTDTSKLVDFMEKYHREKSNLSDIPYDRNSMVSYIDYHIGTSKHVVYVYESDDEITGFILGGLEPFPHNKKYYWASDGMFVADKGGAQLLKRFHAWAFASGAKRIFQGVSSGDWRADNLYSVMKNTTRTGGMYVVHKESSKESI